MSNIGKSAADGGLLLDQTSNLANTRRLWLGRFSFEPFADGRVRVRDRLMRPDRVIPSARFAGLRGRDLDLALLLAATESSTVAPATGPIGDRPASTVDRFFWQFPCRTESDAYERHSSRAVDARNGGSLNLYLGLPWATWIDKARSGAADERLGRELTMQRIRLRGLRGALREFGLDLRLHTVCQHVYWTRLMPLWQQIGVTDLWLSHAPAAQKTMGSVSLHPWRLFAVNVEDPQRQAGLSFNIDPAAKPLLASFVGAHTGAHRTDVRLRLLPLANKAGFYVRVSEKWHFEDVVYRHQVGNEPLESTYQIDHSVVDYNRILSDSVFSLCPSGAGPNSLRLWESLAVGSVPVLLGDPVELPRGGTLPPIDWESIVLRVPDHQIDQLPEILRRIPIEEVRRRQKLGIEAFEKVREQRCF